MRLAPEAARELSEIDHRWMREQALSWLREDLEVCRREFAGGKHSDLTNIGNFLRHSLYDTDLASIRDEREISRLPADEWIPLAMRRRAACGQGCQGRGGEANPRRDRVLAGLLAALETAGRVLVPHGVARRFVCRGTGVVYATPLGFATTRLHGG